MHCIRVRGMQQAFLKWDACTCAVKCKQSVVRIMFLTKIQQKMLQICNRI